MPHLVSLLSSIAILENRFGLEPVRALECRGVSADRLRALRNGTAVPSPAELGHLMALSALAHTLVDRFADNVQSREWLGSRTRGRLSPKAMLSSGRIEAVVECLRREVKSANVDEERVIAQWDGIADTHLVSAQVLIALSTLAVRGDVKGSPGTQADDERALSTGALFCIVAFVEAHINEFFAVATSGVRALTEHLSPPMLSCLRVKWHDDRWQRQASVLEKYQQALRCAGASLFEGGEPVYDKMRAIVFLRNAIVHFVPKWYGPVDDDPEQATRVLVREDLERTGVPRREPLAPNAAIADAYLCTPTVQWAFEAAVAFVRSFCDRVGLPFAPVPTGTLRSITVRLDDR